MHVTKSVFLTRNLSFGYNGLGIDMNYTSNHDHHELFTAIYSVHKSTGTR